jgi:1,2-diacylglycerol 3-alpha-glucosyltransferase
VDAYVPQVTGVVTIVRTLKTELEKRGHNAYVFTVSHPAAKPEEGVFRFSSLRFPYEPEHRVGYFFEPEVVKLAKKLNLDIVHSHTEFSMMLAARAVRRKLRVPSIHTFHTYYPDYLDYVPWPLRLYFKRYMDKYFNFIFRSQKCLVVPSHKNRIFLESIKMKKPVRVIPNGLDLGVFYEDVPSGQTLEWRSKYGIGRGAKVILFTGRLALEKNLNALLESFKLILESVPNTFLMIAGDGPDRRELSLYARELRIEDSVVFTGFLNWPEEIRLACKAADIFMSASRSEVHPVTFIEALSSGLPIVALRDVSIQDMVISGETGCVVESEKDLACAAVRLLTDGAQLSRLKKGALIKSAGYSVERFGAAMIKLYEEIIAR